MSAEWPLRPAQGCSRELWGLPSPGEQRLRAGAPAAGTVLPCLPPRPPGFAVLARGTAAEAPCAELPRRPHQEVCCRPCLHISGSVAAGCNSEFIFFLPCLLRLSFGLSFS